MTAHDPYAPRIPLLGYSDRLSGRPGDRIGFKVSSTCKGPFSARLVRIVSADPNPDGPGIIEEPVEAHFARDYPARVQPFFPGSYGLVERGPEIDGDGSVGLTATIWPTTPKKGPQTILSAGGMTLGIDAAGHLTARAGAVSVSLDARLKTRRWYRTSLRYDAAAQTLSLSQAPVHDRTSPPETATVALEGFTWDAAQAVTMAASLTDGVAAEHYNGKLEAPAIHAGAVDPVAAWDFSRETSTTRIVDSGPQKLEGRLINLPARAMTGSLWDGSEMCWRHAPGHYAAIHFHDDDIYDFDWDDDFTFTIPSDLPSGIYAARIACEGHEDAMPFCVLPKKGERRAKLCVLVSTITYAIYGNHNRPDFEPAWKEVFAACNAYPYNPAEYPEYGCSTYNLHSDGSGVCHASHRRPLFNLKPGYRTFGYGEGSALRHFQADSHLIAWLHAKDIDYDIVTDQELHEEGVAAIAGYRAVTTGSHPEYHTAETLDALKDYRDGGGNLAYLGGNGFYWRVALHQDEPGAIEIRRGEGGIRAWAAEPGEYFNAFDGQYGGLWRRNGRPPQELVGIGFSSQGQFEAMYYRRTPESRDPAVAWIFAGIDEEVIGDFGFSGGGAAGYELDRVDERLGSPEDIVILASSEDPRDTFVLVPEERLTHITNWPNLPEKELLRADMVYFEVPSGGAVFATGSITFCGSLPWNDFDNNVSTLLENVFRRFLA